MTIPLSRIASRDLESVVLSYQQAVHRHQFTQRPQLLDVTLEELLACAPFLLAPVAGPVLRLAHRRHRLARLPNASL